jgi:tetratricopeptide (TPR) repeat protein
MVVATALLLGGCGDKEKKESGTQDEFLKQEKAKQAAAAQQKHKDEAGSAEASKDPTPAAPPTPEPTDVSADDRPAAIPSGEVQNALGLVRRGHYEQAINQCKAALRRNEKYVPAMVVMARAYYHLNKLEFAESVCDIALSIDASSAECLNIKGFVALKNENDPLAREQFDKATKAKDSFGPAWLNLGVQYLKVKNYPAAIPALEKATQLLPNRAEAHLNLGSAYRGAGEVGKAQASYLKALQLKPNYPDAYFNLGILFLDAPSFPGMNRLQQLNTAVDHLNKYKRMMSYLPKDDPADAYIREAQKAYEREQKAMEREAQRKAREAAKKAAPAPTPAPAPAPAPAPKK